MQYHIKQTIQIVFSLQVIWQKSTKNYKNYGHFSAESLSSYLQLMIEHHFVIVEEISSKIHSVLPWQVQTYQRIAIVTNIHYNNIQYKYKNNNCFICLSVVLFVIQGVNKVEPRIDSSYVSYRVIGIV